MSRRFEGKRAIVVGAGQTAGETTGNGRATAQALAREGAHVLVVDRDADSAQQTVGLIGQDGGTALAVTADVTVDADWETIVGAAREHLGDVDVLVNNVGIVIPGATEQLPRESWQTVMDVNLTGMWLGCKAILPLMRERGAGAVVNISSMAGLLPGGEVVAYSTSKAAVNALTRSLALEYAPHGVRVNAVAPGMVDTPLGIDAPARAAGAPREKVIEGRARFIPLPYTATGWDIANACLFLCSDEAAFVTGAILPVDGGTTLMHAMSPRR